MMNIRLYLPACRILIENKSVQKILRNEDQWIDSFHPYVDGLKDYHLYSITTHVVRGIPLSTVRTVSSNGHFKHFGGSRYLEISCFLCQIVAWCVWLGREFIECVRHGESFFSSRKSASLGGIR